MPRSFPLRLSFLQIRPTACAGSIRHRLALDAHHDVAGRDDEEARTVAQVDFVVRGRGARHHPRLLDAGHERQVVREVTHEREDKGGGKGQLGCGADLADFELRIVAKCQGHTLRSAGRPPVAGGGLRQRNQHEEGSSSHLQGVRLAGGHHARRDHIAAQPDSNPARVNGSMCLVLGRARAAAGAHTSSRRSRRKA